jgi:growth hormone-inducible transmembrane protein
MGVFYTPPERTVQKHMFWLVSFKYSFFTRAQAKLTLQAFNACQAATLSPMFFFSPAILSRAALYTCGVVGSLSYVGATAKSVPSTYGVFIMVLIRLFLGTTRICTWVALSLQAFRSLPSVRWLQWLSLLACAVWQSQNRFLCMAVWLCSVVSCFMSKHIMVLTPLIRFNTFLSASTQKILQHARLSEQGLIPRDPMKEAIGLELDMINILYVLFLSVY